MSQITPELPNPETPFIVAIPSTQEEDKKERTMCSICGSYVAKTFFVLDGKRQHICTTDAYTMIRMLCATQPNAARALVAFMNEQVYGKE